MKIERIMFPTDFSRYSNAARQHAIYLCETLGASVYILHAIEPIDYEDYDEDITRFYEGLESEIRKKIISERKHFENQNIKSYANIIIGKRWKVINTYAKEKEIDLIVMGTHGFKTDNGDLTIGTTSHKVMFTSPCPLLIVRDSNNG